MARPEFPTTPIRAEVKTVPSPLEQNGFVQPSLEGIELEQSPEIELGNCTVTSRVQFRRLKKGNEWHCSIHASPDLLHPEQEGMFETHAYNQFADMANKEHLRPGDRALMRGTISHQTIVLENGTAASINHFYLTSLEVLSRSKRTSITEFEKTKK